MSDQQKPNYVESNEETPSGYALSRRDFLRIAGAAGAAGAALVVGGGLPELVGTALAAKPKFDTPTITCVGETQHTIFLQVCAGPSGAPAGFSVQWVKHSDYPALTCDASGQDSLWPASDTTANLCKASFSGTPGCSIYNLAPNACVTVEIGNLNDAVCGVGLSNCGANELDCGTEYVFRAFAHANSSKNRSDFTANQCCSTESCVQGCVFTQGYWKTHGPEGCNPSGGANVWPVTELTIGGTLYTDAQLCTNLKLTGQGNAVLILSHQLIAALLNIANGAEESLDCDVDAASALLTGLDINTASVAPGSTLGQQMTAAAACLDL
ncbi:MAG: twin-arginine translocation signal domain-containing protein, partial [Chloroflexi bacterium]|nr:twin-arginine translocation signal domain-containing protein [Chloroflexota bacterium]